MPISRRMDKKAVYIYPMEYYSAIKENSFESVLMRWMKLEPIIQSEVSFILLEERANIFIHQKLAFKLTLLTQN